MKQNKADVVCFNYNKKGHFKQDYKALRQSNWKLVLRNETAAIKEHVEVF